MVKHPTGEQIQKHLADDLRKVYLQAYDDFAIDPGDVTTQHPDINSRYARELLGVLTNANMLSIQDVNGEQDVWQVATPGTLDSHTREEAEAAIDAWLKQHDLNIALAQPSKSTPKKEKSVSESASPEFKHCLCGCGANVPSKTNYRPGHDARHAGQIGREIAANYTVDGFDRRTLLDALPTDALKRKAEGVAETAIKKAEAKSTNREARSRAAADKAQAKAASGPAFVEGKIRIGRRMFPARKYEGGVIEVNQNQDGDGKWYEPADLTPAQFDSFKPIVTEPIDTTQG